MQKRAKAAENDQIAPGLVAVYDIWLTVLYSLCWIEHSKRRKL